MTLQTAVKSQIRMERGNESVWKLTKRGRKRQNLIERVS